MNAARIHWGRIVIAGFLGEVGIFAVFIPVFLQFGQQAAAYSVPPPAFLMKFLLAVWAGQKIESRFVLHGVLVGVVATLLYVALRLAQPEPSLYVVARGLKVAGGAAAGLVAEKRRRRAMAQPNCWRAFRNYCRGRRDDSGESGPEQTHSRLLMTFHPAKKGSLSTCAIPSSRARHGSAVIGRTAGSIRHVWDDWRLTVDLVNEHGHGDDGLGVKASTISVDVAWRPGLCVWRAILMSTRHRTGMYALRRD